MKADSGVDESIRPFGSSTKRFGQKIKKDQVPGPGNYDVVDTSGISLPKSSFFLFFFLN